MSQSENRELHQLLKSVSARPLARIDRTRRFDLTSYGDEEEKFGSKTQWTTSDGVRFFPASKTTAELIPGVYEVKSSSQGIYFENVPVKTEGLLEFPETNSQKVVNEIQNFWSKEEVFKAQGLTFKRGIILWGPPGSGKSSTIQLVIADVTQNRNGVVFKLNTDPSLVLEGIRIFREVQPTTPVVVLIEDIDAVIRNYDESEVLNILDGVDKIEKIIFLATTNFPEELGERIMNRPSRFDKRFKMPHPKAASRRIYFEYLASKGTTQAIDIDRWVKDTEGMSIAHLKELFINVCILGEDYLDTIETLRTMVEDRPCSTEDEAKIGFFGK